MGQVGRSPSLRSLSHGCLHGLCRVPGCDSRRGFSSKDGLEKPGEFLDKSPARETQSGSPQSSRIQPRTFEARDAFHQCIGCLVFKEDPGFAFDDDLTCPAARIISLARGCAALHLPRIFGFWIAWAGLEVFHWSVSPGLRAGWSEVRHLLLIAGAGLLALAGFVIAGMFDYTYGHALALILVGFAALTPLLPLSSHSQD